MKLLLGVLVLILPTLAQANDVSVVGGGGFAAGEEQDTHRVSAIGATIGFPYNGGSGGFEDARKGTTEQSILFTDLKVHIRYKLLWIIPISKDFRFYANCERGNCTWLSMNSNDPLPVNLPRGIGLEISDESLDGKPLDWK